MPQNQMVGGINNLFNLGAIKLPTPYEVRRYITAQAQGLAYQAPGVTPTQVVTIQIDGTDVGMVTQILSNYLGPAAVTRTGTSSRKV